MGRSMPCAWVAASALLAISLPARAQPDFSSLPCRDPSLKAGEYIDEHLVYFEHGSASLPSASRAEIVLRSAACHIQLRPSAVTIVGHADTSGSPAYNLELSRRRAQAVADRLVALGVDRSRIALNARGESAPAVATGDGVAEAVNRRVLIDWRELPRR